MVFLLTPNVDDTLEVAQIIEFAFDRKQNILEKGENAGY